jgi:hypothetical protein
MLPAMPELLSNLAEADRVNADAIIVGSRGRSGLESALLGSVSHALLEHADRPVLRQNYVSGLRVGPDGHRGAGA